jgi:hypothetical protein
MRPVVLQMSVTLDGFVHGRPVAASPVAAGAVFAAQGCSPRGEAQVNRLTDALARRRETLDSPCRGCHPGIRWSTQRREAL